MADMSTFLVPIVVAVGIWSSLLLRLQRRARGLVLMPFALAGVFLCFWRVPMERSLEAPLEVLALIAAASLIAAPFVWLRRSRREKRAG